MSDSRDLSTSCLNYRDVEDSKIQYPDTKQMQVVQLKASVPGGDDKGDKEFQRQDETRARWAHGSGQPPPPPPSFFTYLSTGLYQVNK